MIIIETIQLSYSGLFYDSVGIFYSMKSNGKLIGKWWTGKDLKESNVFAWRRRVKRRKTTVRLAGVPSEIRTKHFLNKSLGFYY
jgi:hypothetical protein